MLDASPHHSLTDSSGKCYGSGCAYHKEKDASDDMPFIPTPSQTPVLVPKVQSMEEYILKHHKSTVLNELNRQMDAEILAGPWVEKASEDTLRLSNCGFDGMSFWRYDMYTLLVDVVVNAAVIRNGAPCADALYCELWVDMRRGMDFTCGDAGYLVNKPPRDLWKLSSYLVPMLRKDEIEKGSEELLLRYCPDALNNPEEHDAYILAARMELRVEKLALHQRNSTLSILFFCDGTVMAAQAVGDKEDKPPFPVIVPPHTILINTNAVHKDCCQLEIYHECIHYAWHFMFYRLQAMHNNDIQALRTKRVVISNDKAPANPLKWMEWQARRGSFGLMMSLSLMRALLAKHFGNLPQASLHAGQRLDKAARAIASCCGFPKFRVRARLLQMGCIGAKGVLNFVDGAYIQPFAFSLSNGGGDYSFVIDRRSAFDIYHTNEDFYRQISSGRYVFADGHMCLNGSKYVKRSFTRLGLTPWANAHVDECCLRFIHVYEACGVADYCLGAMNSDEEYNRHYFAYARKAGALSEKEQLLAMSRLLDELPDSFQGALTFLMRQAGVTIERLEEEAFLSGRTISRLRTEERREYSLDQIVAVCVALHLPPWLSKEMVRRAGFLFRPVRQHRAYQFILDCLFMDSVRDVQKFLAESGCQPLKLNQFDGSTALLAEG